MMDMGRYAEGEREATRLPGPGGQRRDPPVAFQDIAVEDISLPSRGSGTASRVGLEHPAIPVLGSRLIGQVQGPILELVVRTPAGGVEDEDVSLREDLKVPDDNGAVAHLPAGDPLRQAL